MGVWKPPDTDPNVCGGVLTFVFFLMLICSYRGTDVYQNQELELGDFQKPKTIVK